MAKILDGDSGEEIHPLDLCRVEAKRRHRFERMSDTALYCVCGAIRQAEPQPVALQPCNPCYHWWAVPQLPSVTWTSTAGSYPVAPPVTIMYR